MESLRVSGGGGDALPTEGISISDQHPTIPMSLVFGNKGAGHLTAFTQHPKTRACPFLIRQGYGVEGSPQTPPARVLSYALPLVSILQSHPMAQAQAYIAADGAIRLGKSEDKVLDNAKCIQKAILSLIKAFNLQARFTVHVESAVPEELKKPFQNTRDQLSTILRRKATLALKKFLDQRKTSNEDDAPYRYAAEHALYMGDIPGFELIPRPDSALGAQMFMVGGPSEEIFHQARALIVREHLGVNARTTPQLFTAIGARPPYYFVDGEPSVSHFPQTREDLQSALSAMTSPDADHVRRDYRIMLEALDASSGNHGFDFLKTAVDSLKTTSQ